MSAIKGFLATNFQREQEIYQPTELRGRKSFEALGQKYYSNYWKTKKTTATIEEMQEVADEFLRDSGFVGFIEKAIAPLVTDAAPSMITIKGALNDIGQRFASFLSCVKSQKEVLDENIYQLNFTINQLNFDLAEVIAIYADQESKRTILDFVDREFSKKLLSVFNDHLSSLKTKINNLISGLLELDNDKLREARSYPILGIAFEQMILSDLDFNVYDITRPYIIEYSYDIKNSFDEHTNNSINQINNSLNKQHKTVLYKAKQRLGRSFFYDLQSSKYDSSKYDFSIYTTENKFLPKKLRGHKDFKEYKDNVWIIVHDIEGRLNGFYNNTIMNAQICLTKDIEIFFEERDKFLKEYQQDLQSSLKAVQNKQNSYSMLKNKYVQLLGKTANLEKDLKYLQEYFKQH
jgi:hypothetical protein